MGEQGSLEWTHCWADTDQLSLSYVLWWDSPKEQMHCLSVPHGLGVSGAVDFYAMKWKGPAYEPWLRHGTEPCLTILFPLGLLSFAESPAFFSLFVPFSPGVACPCISQFYCAKLGQVAKSWSLTYIPDMLYFKVIHRNSSSVFWGIDWGQWQDLKLSCM